MRANRVLDRRLGHAAVYLPWDLSPLTILACYGRQEEADTHPGREQRSYGSRKGSGLHRIPSILASEAQNEGGLRTLSVK